MTTTLLNPRLLAPIAIAGFVLGIALLYLGYPAIGPIALFIGVLCTILTAIMITTPEDQVIAARKSLAEAPHAEESVQPAGGATSATPVEAGRDAAIRANDGDQAVDE